MEGLLKLIAGKAGGPESGELASGGTPAFEKHTIKGGVGASSVCFHCAGPKDILFISELGRQHVTGRGAWHRSTHSPCPPPGVAGCEGC